MQHKFRLLLTAGLAAFIVAACGSETDGDASVDETLINTDEVEVINTSSEVTAAEETSSPEETVTEESSTTETPEAPEETEALADENEESIEPILQTAVNQLIEVTDIELETSAFQFETTEEYVEVEVREQTDAAVTPLIGTYRYILDTQEILVSDYLTGEFIPYKEVK